MARINFLISVMRRRLAGQDTSCPFCGSGQTSLIGRKALVLELRRCARCALMYRYPKDDVRINSEFYQADFEGGVVTDVPSESRLSELVASEFRGTMVDFSRKIALIKELAPGGRLLDYGCSWGYTVHQFRQAGFDAVGFEISGARAEYGRTKLGVDIVDSFTALDKLAPQSFDVVYSHHVLEHLPDLKPSFATFRRLLKPSGKLIIFVPNGAGEKARRLGTKWGGSISENHALALDAHFFARNLPDYAFTARFATDPYDTPLRACEFFSTQPAAAPLNGDELLVVADLVGDARSEGVYSSE